MLITALIATDLIIILFLAWKAFTAPHGEEIPGVGFVELDLSQYPQIPDDRSDRGNVVSIKRGDA